MKKLFLLLFAAPARSHAYYGTWRRRAYCLLFFAFCLLITVPCLLSPVYASYVLPYPSYMPGNKLYTISRIVDRLNNWWHFGSIAQIKYHLKLSDKYLVESKTLFEYQQYLLAVDALNRSDEEYSAIPEYIHEATQEGKDVRNLSETVRSAAIKHTEVLTNISALVPKSFLWVPEKSTPTDLDLQSLIFRALRIRKSTISEFSEQDTLLPTITVINLIRGNGLGHENDDLGSSLKAQWQVTQESQVNATWLLQYGALENQNITDLARNEMSGQEFGLLFEIDRNFAEKSNILFRGQGAWYFSDGIFLNAYDVNERHALIDTAFSKFKQVFGYYPKTVGAWWIGGDSLTYMQKKYGITAALRAADQFDLDMYSIWGTPWSIPYIASKTNEAIPAKSFEESSKVVILQWAARDPLEGYFDPLFSLQDYSTKGYGTDYVNYLAGIFLNMPFNNLVIGLENGGTLEGFNKSYKTMLSKAKELEADKKASILFVKDFSRQFLDQGKVFPYTSYFLSEDYDSKNQSFWYISGNYRAALHKNNDSIYVIDIRDYSNKIDEDYSVLPNGQSRLRINTPEIIESIRFPENKILLKTTTESMTLKENNNEVALFAGNDSIAYFTPTKMKIFIGDTASEKIYDFGRQRRYVTLISILFGIFSLYFLMILINKKNVCSTLKSFLPLVIPLFFASFFLVSQSVFLFDKKETVLLTVFFSLRIFSISKTLVMVKIIPFIILFIAHYISVIAYPNRITKTMYYIVLSLITFLYFHIPYFPLDKSTFQYVGSVFVLLFVLLSVFAICICKKIVQKRDIYLVVASVPIVILMLIFTTVYSRSRLALTNYEISALEVIKNSKKDVIYVEQFDYSIRPIYKAVKPLLYNNFQIGQNITNKKWKKVVRPSNNILQLTDYDNTLIIIPKYLGSDISDNEINILKIKKIFDNAQIQIYEKN